MLVQDNLKAFCFKPLRACTDKRSNTILLPTPQPSEATFTITLLLLYINVSVHYKQAPHSNISLQFTSHQRRRQMVEDRGFYSKRGWTFFPVHLFPTLFLILGDPEFLLIAPCCLINTHTSTVTSIHLSSKSPSCLHSPQSWLMITCLTHTLYMGGGDEEGKSKPLYTFTYIYILT